MSSSSGESPLKHIQPQYFYVGTFFFHLRKHKYFKRKTFHYRLYMKGPNSPFKKVLIDYFKCTILSNSPIRLSSVSPFEEPAHILQGKFKHCNVIWGYVTKFCHHIFVTWALESFYWLFSLCSFLLWYLGGYRNWKSCHRVENVLVLQEEHSVQGID